MIGRKMMELQLRRIGVFDAEETISSHPNFDENFKICEFYNHHQFPMSDEFHSLSLHHEYPFGFSVCYGNVLLETYGLLHIQYGQTMGMT